MENSLIPDLVAVLVTAGFSAWICHKVKISPVIGYLLSGIIVGPFTMPHLVSNTESIHTLANLGLILVMFFIGLELSLKRLKSLGMAPLLVTVLTALLIFNGVRLGGGLFGLNGVQSLFVAGTIMISSSVIVNRIMGELALSRESFARNAIGVTLLEDAVAVSMLAILGSIGVSSDGGASGGQPNVIPLIGRLAGFVLLALVGALIFVPKLLDQVKRLSNEVTDIMGAGVLFGLAYLAASAGYSLALGAFLLGSVIGGTRHKGWFLQSFEGMHDVFSAIFFVSMGMLFDVSLFLPSLGMALGLTVAAIIGRTAAAMLAFVVAGKPLGFALKSACCLIPLGEFSFVIAQLGVQSGKMPDTFFPACVSAVLLTTILAPWTTRIGIKAGDRIGNYEPRLLTKWRELLGKVLEGAADTEISARIKESGIFSKCVRLAMLLAFILSFLAFSPSMSDWLREPLNGIFSAADSWIDAHDIDIPGKVKLFDVTFWSLATLLLLAPTLVMWKTFRATARQAAEVLVNHKFTEADTMTPAQHVFALTVEKVVLVAGACSFLLLLGAVMPASIPFTGKSIVLLILVLLIGGLVRQPLARLQVKVQEEIIAEVEGGPLSEVPSMAGGVSSGQGDVRSAMAETAESLASDAWSLKVQEVTIMDASNAVGLTLMETNLRRDFGCTVAAIDRRGVVMSNPPAGTRIFPDDIVLLVGTESQLKGAVKWLRGRKTVDQIVTEQPFSELATESVAVPMSFSRSGSTLAELGVAGRFHVMILGVQHSVGGLVQNPSGSETVCRGDHLLILGFPEQNRAFRAWMGEASMVPTKVGESHIVPEDRENGVVRGDGSVSAPEVSRVETGTGRDGGACCCAGAGGCEEKPDEAAVAAPHLAGSHAEAPVLAPPADLGEKAAGSLAETTCPAASKQD